MNKGAILTSGYFNLNKILRSLSELDYNVVTMYYRSQTSDTYIIDECDALSKIRTKELGKEGFSIKGRAIQQNEYTEALNYILALFSFGGKGFEENEHFAGLIGHEFLVSLSNINAAYKFVKESNEKYKYKAALFHADGGIWYSAIVACKELGIPTFVCFNGAITECISRHSTVMCYVHSDTYYLHGLYNLDWLADRYDSKKELVIVGQPSFDNYYNNDSETEPNTFLYNSKAIFSQYGSTKEAIVCLLDISSASFLSHKFSPAMDIDFLQAFAVYQQKINPEAKLVISLRPYHSSSNIDYIKFVSNFGIENFQVYGHTHIPLRELLPTMEYVVTGASTVAIEGMINRKGVVLLPGVSSKYAPFRFLDDWAVCPDDMSIDSVVEGLNMVTKRKDVLVKACNKHAPYYNYKDDGKASERIVKDLVSRL